MGNENGAQEDGQGGYLFANNYKANFGYKVIELAPKSPAAKAGLEPFLDYVLYSPAVTGERKLLFSEYLQENIGKEVIFKVYNMIQQGTRLVHIDLTALLPQAYQEEDNLNEQKQVAQSVHEKVLGAKLKYEQYDDAHHKILAVADVYLGSPAQEADLQPFQDFILGTKELTFSNLESFAKYITINQNQQLSLYLYNIDLQKVRCAYVTPRDNWSGQGLIGADISFGYLNKLPMRKRDIQHQRKAEQMKNIFGGLGSGPANNRVPTQEGLSDDEDNKIEETKNDQDNLAKPIAYEEAADEGEDSYYDEEEDGDDKEP